MNALKTLAKDLLYTRNNLSLDIARLCSFLSMLAYWGGCLWSLGKTGVFNPVEVGGGCAAIMAGAGGWIYFRQSKEPATAEGAP